MRFVFYTHSLVSDWNHGNAHFLRGVMRELVAAGHDALALEPEDSWSRVSLVADQGELARTRFAADFPMLRSLAYGDGFDHEAALAGTDVVIVHEWTQPALVERIGRIRRAGGRFALLFHDTHHRAVSSREEIAGLILSDYDAILAFGQTLRERYLKAGWGRRVVTWHEAADVALFRPISNVPSAGDLVWVGNWGDDERSEEIASFLIEPAHRLGLKASVRGVRYPPAALERLAKAGIGYGGWVANADAPRLFAAHRATVHIPRRPYVTSQPGIPTIRMFEALACGIPLISAPWQDAEGLFRAGQDFLFAKDGGAMTEALRAVLSDDDLRGSLVACGLQTIRGRHTCAHRVRELFGILDRLGVCEAVEEPLAREAAQ